MGVFCVIVMWMKVNFLTTTNTHNGYGMTREYFLKYLPKEDIILEPKGDNETTLVLHVPPAIQHVQTPIKVLYTMLEGDTVPDSWKPHLEKATHILVPTNFVAETFKRAGFTTTVIPLGYDPDLFKSTSKKENNKSFTFLHYEAFQDRKGWQDLLDAWLLSGLAEEEFDAKLILKTVRSFKEVYEVLQDRKIDLFYNTEVICGKLPHESLPHLLNSADCFVFPSRGEGFSLPPLEAMACGTPLIVSKGHSHMDFYDERYMYGADCDIKIPATYSNWEDQGNFVRCNVDGLAKVLRSVYDYREEAKQKSLLALDYVKKWQYPNTARMIKEFLCRM